MAGFLRLASEELPSAACFLFLALHASRYPPSEAIACLQLWPGAFMVF
jgi:hypothetical protein